MKQRSRILEEPSPPPAMGKLDKTRLVPLRNELRELDKEVQRLRDEHRATLTAMLDARESLFRKINALEA